MNSENVGLFSKLDIRVGKIVKAEVFEEAIKPAYILTIDFGEEIGLKKTSAQITNYDLNSLTDKKCIAVINLGEKQIGPIMSQCLVLGSISKKLDFLIVGNSKPTKKKIDQAKSLGIKVITENEWEKILNS